MVSISIDYGFKGVNRPSGSGKVLFIVYMVTLQNGSGTDLEHQGKCHNVFQWDLAAATAAAA